MSFFQKSQIKLMKDYINYDRLVDELINDKDRQILKAEIDILNLEEMKQGFINEKKRIEMERDNSNLGHTIHYIFVNPYNEYLKLTEKLNK
jgi:hypothetical protein